MSQIKQKCQAAFSALLEKKSKESHELIDCRITPALTEQDYDLPAIVVRSIKAEELAPGSNVHEVELVIAVASSPDDDVSITFGEDSTSRHAERTRAVFQTLFDVSKDETELVARAECLAALNKPEEAEDERKVKEFTCSNYLLVSEEDGQVERHVEDSFTLLVTCSYGDPEES